MDPKLVDLIANQEVDFGKQSSDYRNHRPGMPDSFYNRIVNACKFHGVHLLGKEFDWKGLTILDLGTGNKQVLI